MAEGGHQLTANVERSLLSPSSHVFCLFEQLYTNPQYACPVLRPIYAYLPLQRCPNPRRHETAYATASVTLNRDGKRQLRTLDVVVRRASVVRDDAGLPIVLVRQCCVTKVTKRCDSEVARLGELLYMLDASF